MSAAPLSANAYPTAPPSYQPPVTATPAAQPVYSNVPVAYGVVANPVIVVPQQQVMVNGNYKNVLEPMPGLLVRQKLRLQNLCVCLLRNKYDIGPFPQGMDPSQPWEDEVFKQQKGLLYASEESECIDKVCCHRYRKFTMNLHMGRGQDGPEVLRFERPFKCPVVCCCAMPWPQEIHALNPQTGEKLGTVKQDWRCCAALCGKLYWKAYDNVGQVTHVFERDICCNSNMCAPSCCCEVHRIDIKDKNEVETIGSLENIFPGCSCRTLCFGNMIDNYRLTFPPQANAEEKATLLAGLMLIDYMLFANADDNQQ